MKHMSCTNDERVSTEVRCIYKPARKVFGIFTAGLTILNPAKYLFVSISQIFGMDLA
jgi:hypothetical protein